MQILFTDFYQIDSANDKVIPRDITKAFDIHVKSLNAFILKNESIQMYKTRSDTTEVVALIKNIINIIDKKDLKDDGIMTNVRDNNKKISERLLREEIERQVEIERLGIEITRGNLLLTCLKENETYRFLVSKVNNSFFIDDSDLNEKRGFSSKDMKIWKTAVFECHMDEADEVIIDNIKVYLKDKATYWWDMFLEIDKMQNDEVNTNLAHTNIERVLTNMLKQKSPSDYFCLSNAVISYMKKGGHIDYVEMINNIFDDYHAEDLTTDEMTKVKKRLYELPKEKKFDCQFESVPSQVKTRVKKLYPIMQGVELKINGPIDDKSITAIEDDDGNKFIQIKTTDLETFKTFIKKEIKI